MIKSKKKRLICYPVKLGFKDSSGKDENYITDAKNDVLVHGWGDCCQIGGIQERNIALSLIKLLNTHKPKIMVTYHDDDA